MNILNDLRAKLRKQLSLVCEFQKCKNHPNRTRGSDFGFRVQKSLKNAFANNFNSSTAATK
jgi:hypothetical protein